MMHGTNFPQSHVPSSTLNVAFPLFLLFRMLHDETSFSTFELILEICLGKAVERFFAFGYPSTRRKLCKFRLACWCRLMHFLDGNHITFAFLSLTCLGFFVDKLFPICIKIYNFTVLIMLLCLHAKSRFSLFFFVFVLRAVLCLPQFTGSLASGTASVTDRTAGAEATTRESHYAKEPRTSRARRGRQDAYDEQFVELVAAGPQRRFQCHDEWKLVLRERQ